VQTRGNIRTINEGIEGPALKGNPSGEKDYLKARRGKKEIQRKKKRKRNYIKSKDPWSFLENRETKTGENGRERVPNPMKKDVFPFWGW